MGDFSLVEVSSESHTFPLRNLFLSKSWETAKPFPEASFVLKFQTRLINSIKLEPINARFVEILVAKDQNDTFVPLLSKTALDAKCYTFTKLNFDYKETAKQEWNRIKVILHQKEFKLCLGLKIFEINTLTTVSSSIEVPDISDNEREDIKTCPVIPKMTFEKTKSTTIPPLPDKTDKMDVVNVVEAKRKRSDSSTEQDEEDAPKSSKPPKKKKVYKFKPIVTSSEDENDAEEVKQVKKNVTDVKSTPSSTSSSLEVKKETKTSQPKSKSIDPQPLSKVVLVISGIANPERAEIKDVAISLGAQYRPNWTRDSTHLICAMENTDKFHEAKNAGGKVVTKDWIFACKKKNKKLPEGKYGFGKVETLKGDENDETDEDERYELNSEDEKFIDDTDVLDPPSDEEFDPNQVQEEEATTPLFQDEPITPITPITPKTATPKPNKSPTLSVSVDFKPIPSNSDPNLIKIKTEIEKIREKGKDPIPFIEETFEKVKQFALKGDASEVYEHWNENVPIFSEIRKSIHSIENQSDLVKALDQWKKIYLEQANGNQDLLDFLTDVKAYLDPSIKDTKKVTRLIYAYGGETTAKLGDATHILCEEDANPTYKKGIVVSIQWILQCHQKKKLVNMQPFVIE